MWASRSLFSEVGAGGRRKESGCVWLRAWSLEPDRPGLESQLCCFLAVSPWVSYFTWLAVFPHMKNRVKVHAVKALFFPRRLQGLLPFKLFDAGWVRLVSWVGRHQWWEGKSHQLLLDPSGLSLDPGGAEAAPGIPFRGPPTRRRGRPGIPRLPGTGSGPGPQRRRLRGTLRSTPPPPGWAGPARWPCPRPAGLGDWLVSAPPPPHQPRRRQGGEPSRQLAAAASAVPPSVRSGGDNGRPAGPCTRGGRPR